MAYGYKLATVNDSPWTREYEVSTEDIEVRPGQSWLDPTFPELDPRTFNPVNPPEQHALNNQQPSPMGKPPPQDLDALFWSEMIQAVHFGGLRSWEAAALANPAWSNSPLLNCNLPVNQSSWLSIFKKPRWCNLQRPILETTPGLGAAGFGPNDFWSVDNPVIWEQLSYSIEIANRIMLQAFKSRWLRSYLTPEAWSMERRDLQDGQRVGPVHPNVNTQSFFPLQDDLIKTEQQSLAWFSELFAARKPVWHLYAETDNRRRNWVGLAVPDLSWRDADGRYVKHFIVNIDVNPLRTLLNPNAAAHARYIARATLAVTICHELMHILRLQMLKQRGEKLLSFEPFYNGEHMAEVGHSFINDLFGIAAENVQLLYLPPLRGLMPKSGAYLSTAAAHFPQSHINRRNYVAPVHVLPAHQAYPLANRENLIYPVPVFWWRALSNEGFWNNHVPQFGQTALNCPLVLKATGLLEGSSSFHQTYAEWDPAAINAVPPFFQLDVQVLQSDLTKIRQAVKGWRPWHFASAAQWRSTVYSCLFWRQRLQKMGNAFSAPLSLLKEQEAASFVESLMNANIRQEIDSWQQWPWQGWNGVLTDAEVIRYVTRCKAWFYRAMAFLVIAALPPRNHAVTFRDPPPWPGPNKTWRPSGNQNYPADWNPQAFHQAAGGKQYTLSPRHQPDAMYATEVLARESNISLAFRSYQMHEWCTLTPIHLRAAFGAHFNAQTQHMQTIRQQLALNPMAPQWMFQFTFQLPGYSEIIQFRGVQHNSLTYGNLRAMNPLRGLGHLFPANTDLLSLWNQLMRDEELRPPELQGANANLARILEVQKMDYLTLGQLYDLRLTQSDVLVLVLFDSEIEIYRLAYVLQVLSLTEEEIRSGMETSPYGYTLNKELSHKFNAENTEVSPLGRVAQWLREEDIALRDGKEGNPHWITVGGVVFDVTELDKVATDEQETLVEALWSAPGGNPMSHVIHGNHDPNVAIGLIRPLRVGMTIPYGLSINSGTNRIYGQHELGWHEFPETRQYVQIYDDVYDITEYAEWHPGGMKIMTSAAGSDATALFEEHHPENGRALLEDIKGLSIGRVVSSQSQSQELGATHICINDNVFDISPLQTTNNEIFVALEFYAGQDASEKLPIEVPTEDHPLLLLSNTMTDLIIAKITKTVDELPRMNQKQLRSHDGAEIDDRGYAASYVAYDNLVFDVTTLMQYGPGAITAVLSEFIGSRIERNGPHDQVGQLLQDQYSFRTVARLVIDDEVAGQQAASAGHWDPYRSRTLTREDYNTLLAVRAKELQTVGLREADDQPVVPGLETTGPAQLPSDIVPKTKMPVKKKKVPGQIQETLSERSNILQKAAISALAKLQDQLAAMNQSAQLQTTRRLEEASRQMLGGRKRSRDAGSSGSHKPPKRVRVV